MQLKKINNRKVTQFCIMELLASGIEEYVKEKSKTKNSPS
jgi:hypothetical protein